MKVVEIHSKDKKYYGWDGFRIDVDGKSRISVGRPEPEDCSIDRDLSFVFKISRLMQEAYEAGKRGESFEVDKIEVDPDDF